MVLPFCSLTSGGGGGYFATEDGNGFLPQKETRLFTRELTIRRRNFTCSLGCYYHHSDARMSDGHKRAQKMKSRGGFSSCVEQQLKRKDEFGQTNWR